MSGNENDLFTEVNAIWIDFSLNCRNCFSADIFNININRTMEVYKKLIYVYDDFTYDELDCEALATIRKEVLGFWVYAGVKCGGLSHRCIEYNFGKDFNSGETGINKYSINTVEVTNQIHKWLADRGERKRWVSTPYMNGQMFQIAVIVAVWTSMWFVIQFLCHE